MMRRDEISSAIDAVTKPQFEELMVAMNSVLWNALDKQL